MTEIDLLGGFLHVYSFPMSLIGHNWSCLRARRLKISGFSCLSVMQTWGKFEADPTTPDVNHCCFGSERLICINNSYDPVQKITENSHDFDAVINITNSFYFQELRFIYFEI